MKEYDIVFDLDNPRLTHTILVNMVGTDKRVVDFGCHNGFLSKVLKDRGCSVVGIELDPEAAEQARSVCDKVICADLDELDLVKALDGERFDVGLFGDVVEHLKDPRRVLVQMRELLAPGGYIVVSVPNVAHISIRLKMLKGEFEYEERGILDDTHLRFFTANNITSFMESCGYLLDTMDCMQVGISEEDIRAALNPLGIGDWEAVRRELSSWEALAFQFIVKAVPADEAGLISKVSEDKAKAEMRLRSLERDFKNNAAELVVLRQALAELKEEFDKASKYARRLEAVLQEKEQEIAQLKQTLPGPSEEGPKRRRHRG